MEVFIENILAYVLVIGLILMIIIIYLRKQKRESVLVEEKIEKAKEYGFHEPVSLHPVINTDICIGSAACVKACPEQDILGIRKGHGTTINASHCVGHGACFHACPLGAISLVMGTEKRGVELPHVNQTYETNVQGIYIAGELGGMGLIKNAVEQGKQAMEHISKRLSGNIRLDFDVIIIGAGPAGIAATLTAKKNKLRYLTLEQDSLGGTVYSFPRKKIIMTSPMDLPLYGKVKLVETSKTELLELWNDVLKKNNIIINEHEKVIEVRREGDYFRLISSKGEYTSSFVLLSIGRRGSPRKLGVPGEISEKVAYKLIEPELIANSNVLVVGGGDSAIEAAILLAENSSNNVTLSYRASSFSRLKPRNFEKISNVSAQGSIDVIYNSNIKEILPNKVILTVGHNGSSEIKEINNDQVYIFAGGELPNSFLANCGIKITKKFGEVIMKGE